ncbi:MAG: response regulator [Hyphomicrobiaceae bacterium]
MQSTDLATPDEIARTVQLPTTGSAKILLAEDNPTNAMVAKTILRRAGYDVEHVVDGEKAFAAVSAKSFDIILMDISMPGMDGIEATRLIRQLPTNCACVPIVAMTAHSLSGDKERFLDAGMNDYVTKPIRKELLIKAIEENVIKSTENGADDAKHRSSPLTAQEIAFDKDEIAQLYKDVGADAVRSLMAQFAADIEQSAKAVRDGVAALDLKATLDAAHAVRGCAATLGAVKLSASAARIEVGCVQADWQEIEKAMDEFMPLQLAAVEYAKNFAS